MLATEDRVIPPPGQHQTATRANASIAEVTGSHAVYISQPKAVADAIDKQRERLHGKGAGRVASAAYWFFDDSVK